MRHVVIRSVAGATPYSLWRCGSCDDGDMASSVQDWELLRADAMTHVLATGHPVTIVRGTGELLIRVPEGTSHAL